MDGKRIPIHNAKTVTSLSSSKSKVVSSLKTKGDAALRAGSNASSAKSTGKDKRPKSENNNKSGGDPLSEETKLDLVDSSFNSYINSTALEILLRKSKLKSKADIDKQIATLQKRVSDNLNVLEETKTKVSTLYLLENQNNLLTDHSTALKLCSNEPAFTEGKSYEELMFEIDRVKNQLPCKTIHVPILNAEMANFQVATSQLLGSLERISATYGADQGPIIETASELDEINTVKESVEAGKQSIDAISNMASASVLKDKVFKNSS